MRSRFRWVIIALLFFITVVNYIDRSAISYAISDISKVLHLNADQTGLILGAFGVGYMITTFFGGIWVDHVGARRALFWASLLWTLSIGLTGAAVGFAMIFLMRILLGVAEGPNFPAVNRAVGDWLSSRERAIALSNSLVAVPLALAIGGPIATALILGTSWRGMFIILGIIGLIWVPVWYFLFRDFPEHSKRVNDAELRHIRGTDTIDRSVQPADMRRAQAHRLPSGSLWKYLLANRTLMANNWSFFVFGYYLFFFMTWLPSYFEKQYHLNLKSVGLFSVLPWALATVLLWLVGYLSDGILKRTGSLRLARSYPIWISQLLSALCVIPLTFTHNFTIAIIFITLAVGFGMSSNSTFYAINVDMMRDRTGTALGVMDTFFAIAGFLAPVITGAIVNATGSFNSAFWLMAALAATSVLAVLFFHHPDKQRRIDNPVAPGSGRSIPS
ncbi:sugar phosphate permease [Alicyclobacillus sacchari]|uniref:Sugar phosphate permease n=1 Tax=Alicyclobacillus sacchari TaxID=392010 RepID=A0A4R8LX81_9BACL|nr:MFS transporter [Alicyclobacillus sacchari]TDY51425.1 sugar phosphate permease [Alicyclobacillus sacchari]